MLGIGFMAIATVRFVRTARLLDDQKVHPFGVFTDGVDAVDQGVDDRA